jgi:hypothetical protein
VLAGVRWAIAADSLSPAGVAMRSCAFVPMNGDGSVVGFAV